MTRQQRRNAERRIKKGQFPFPEFGKWIGNYAARHPEVFLFCKPGDIESNLSGEKRQYTLEELYTFLLDFKAKDEQEQYDLFFGNEAENKQEQEVENGK